MKKYNVQLMGNKTVTVYYTFEVEAESQESAEDAAFKLAETLHARYAVEAGVEEINWTDALSTEEV